MYSNAIFYADIVSDPAFVALWTAPSTRSATVFSNPSGSIVRGYYINHNLVTGAIVEVLGCTSSYANDMWKVLVFDADNFDLVGADWDLFDGADVTGDVFPIGGSSWSDAWVTLEDVNSNWVQPGDIIRVAKTPNPTSVGNAGWVAGPMPDAKSIDTSSNSTPIVIESFGHGFTTGDIVRVSGHEANTTANGVWAITVLDPDLFELNNPVTGADSIGTDDGFATGICRVINSQIVTLSAADNATISRCEAAWTQRGGFIQTLSPTPTAGGLGYDINDLLTITTGGGDAVAEVLGITETGPVTGVNAMAMGAGYVNGNIVTINSPNFNCQLIVTTTGGGGSITGVSIFVAGTGYSTGVYGVTGGSGGGGQVQVTAVEAGAVTLVALYTQTVFGGYSVAPGLATTGGTGSGCTLNVTQVTPAGTATLTTGAQGKYGEGYAGFTANFGAGRMSLIAHETIPLANLSAYRELSFWARTETVGGIALNAFVICLCSDTAGQVVVDAFKIPKTTTVGRWRPITAIRTGGVKGFASANLGASIQSIALYSNTGSVALAGVQLDCVIASLEDGLNLSSTLSQSALPSPPPAWAKASAKPVYLIQSIDGALVFLDSTPSAQTAPTNSVKLGNAGATGSFVTYQRRGLGNESATLLGSAAMVQGGGAPGNLVTISGGWNTGTTLQDGETVLDGLSGYGVGMLLSAPYVALERFTFQRYNYGIKFLSAAVHGCVVTSASCVGIDDTAFMFDEANQNTVTVGVISHAGTGVQFENCSENLVLSLQHLLRCGGGVWFNTGSHRNVISSGHIEDCWVGSRLYGTNNLISDLWFASCNVAIENIYGINFGRRIEFSDCNADVHPWLANLYRLSRFQVEDYDYAGESRIFERGGEVVSLATDRVGGSGRMWRTSFPVFFGLERPTDDPMILPVARVPLVGGLTTTITAYVRKSHATNVAVVLRCKGNQIAGIANDVVTTDAASIVWQELTLSLAPSVDGVVEIELLSSRASTGAVGYVDIDSVTVAQGV